jgi:hypothetical protein
MDKAIEVVNEIKEKTEGDIDKLEKALEILKSVDIRAAAPAEVEPEVEEPVVEVEPEVEEPVVEVEPEVQEHVVEAEPEAPEAPESPVEVQPESEGSPFEVKEENNDADIPPVSELKELQDMNNEMKEPKEEGFGETFNNMVESTKDLLFSPKKEESEAQKGGKRRNRKSKKGLRTKRFRGGNNRKTRKGRRNSRRLRK